MDTSGSAVASQGHYPYGESWYESGGTNKLKFTSYERDSESGNDYAIMRYHVNRLGRFSSPDPIAGNAANPQSLNRYGYSLNNPVNLTDALGLSPCGEEEGMRPCPLQYEAGDGVNGWGSTGCVQCQFNLEILLNSLHIYPANLGVFLNGEPLNEAAVGIMPGSKFESEQAAAVAAFWVLSIRSFVDQYEYGVKIYRFANGGYSYTQWAQGDSQCLGSRSCGVTIGHLSIPEGTSLVATLHTHPGDPPTPISNLLSTKDYSAHVAWQVPHAYIASIDGPRLILYDISQGMDALFNPVVILGLPLPWGP